ncbi:MAG: toll/interleukin-1 receptor domain-containing protein [Anaerolineales bacterium]|nr:toll/interleukin-1 receptor domain-containing protein [Anaerolineales bacterium]
MPRKNKTPNNNTASDKSIIINGDVNNSNIIIGDNSSLSKSASTEQQLEKIPASPLQIVVGSESTGSKLIPFLCYAKENSPDVREFRERLKAEDWVDPWFDEEDILPGQMWEASVTEAVYNCHAVIIFLSSIAVRTEGFFHKELKLALDAAAEKPDGTIFIIPIRLDVCDVPDRLQPYQYVDYFGDKEHKENVYSSLITALKTRAENLGIKI